MSARHAGKVAVITGAASGIGQAYAQRLAQDGASVAVVDLKAGDQTVDMVRSAGGNAAAFSSDVSDPVQVTKLAEQVTGHFGRCDILVNNAGIYPVQSFDAISFDDWRRVMSINLDAPFLMIKAFVPGMRQRRWGRIINQASNAFAINLTGFTHYIASKGGVIGLTRALASEFGGDGITVNALAPGLVRTPGTAGRADMPGGAKAGDDEFAMAAGHQAIKRSQMPEDLVGTLSFLASDDAAFMTGQTLVVDGGQVRS